MLQLIYNKLLAYSFLFIVLFLILSIFNDQSLPKDSRSHLPLVKTSQSESTYSHITNETISLKKKIEIFSEQNVLNEISPASQKTINISNYPVKVGYVSSRFGLRKDPIHGKSRLHKGLDIAAQSGTFVYPLGEGKVIFSGYKSGYGNVVEIKHGETVVTRYAHLAMSLIDIGKVVDKNVIIGLVGNTGRSTGPHLHLEVTFNGLAVNPEPYLEKVRPSSIAQK